MDLPKEIKFTNNVNYIDKGNGVCKNANLTNYNIPEQSQQDLNQQQND